MDEREEDRETRMQALEGLNEAVRRCMRAGISLGVMEMWNGVGRWCLCFEAEVMWDEVKGFSLGCEDEEQ